MRVYFEKGSIEVTVSQNSNGTYVYSIGNTVIGLYNPNVMKDEKIVESINSDIRKIEEYISIIDKIINIEKEEEKLDKLIDEKMDDLDIRDLEFEKMKDEEHAKKEAMNPSNKVNLNKEE